MFKKILFTFLFVANAFMLIAQSHYPVQIQPLVITPSVYLQDYVDQNNLQVKVSLNDLSKQNFQIRLKMTISDGKSFLHTSANGIVLTLNGGQVYYLTNEELDTLFSPKDLGLGETETLKEGMYSFSFEATTVFDNTVKVSNKSLDFTQTLVVLNDPPLLNMPIKDSELDLTQIGSSMQFAWMPRSFFTSPNRQVKYAIKIVKVDPIDLNPYQAIESKGPNVVLDLKGIDAPFLIYDPSMLMLEKGAVYAWQIRAYEEVISNGEITQFGARFKNEGFSEVQTFSTKDVCPAITIVAQPATGATPVVLSWTTGTGAGTPSQYEVQYREQGTTLPYTIVRTSENSITLDNTQIQEGLTYEYNVAVLCKKWQAPVYGGTFKLQKPSCAPPSPIKIENPNVKGEMVLSWDLPAEQSLTAFKVSSNNGTDGDKETNIPVVDGTKSYSITLPVLTAGGYNIQIDGVCDQTNALGKKQFVAYNDNGFIGACPLPTPLTFYATRLKGDSARITFTNNQLHQSYVLKYWELSKGISKAITVNIPTAIPETKLPNIADNVLYQYQITFVCAGGKTTETGIGMFKIDPANNLDPNITPPTGNCFPPAQIAAEARSTTSAKFDWGKSKGADEYQLLYRVQGSTGNFQIFNTTASDAKLTGLVDSKIYEYKIKSRCGSAYSIESSLGTVDLSKPTINAKCDTIPYVRINKTTQTEIQLAWKYDDTLKRTGYTIFYKQDSQSWDDQYLEDFQDLKTFSKTNVSHDTARFTINNLKPGTKYNFKIQATCGTDKAQANEVISGTTTEDKSPKGCESSKACDRTSKIPVSSLKEGDVIGVADYNVKIKEITPIDGSSPQTYQGNGIVDAPFIGMSENLAMNVSFDNLLVNDKMCTLKGDINLDSASFYLLDEKTRTQVRGLFASSHEFADAVEDFSAEFDKIVEDVFGKQVEIKEEIDSTIVNDNAIVSTQNLPIDETPVADDLTKSTSNTITTTDNTTTSSTSNNSNTTDSSINTELQPLTGIYKIKFGGKLYGKGDTIISPFSRKLFSNAKIEMVVLPKLSSVNWFTLNSDASTIYDYKSANQLLTFNFIKIPTLTFIGNNYANNFFPLNFTLKSRYNDIDTKPEILVNFIRTVPDFKINGLDYIVKKEDDNNPKIIYNRIAKAGETMYFVVDQSLKVMYKNNKYVSLGTDAFVDSKATRTGKFTLTLSPNLPEDAIPEQNIRWTAKNYDLVNWWGKKTIDKFISNPNMNARIYSSAGYPLLKDGFVDIKWLKKNPVYLKLQSEPRELFGTTTAFKQIQRTCAILELYLSTFKAGKSVELVVDDIEFGTQSYNKEHDKSREYLKMTEIETKGGLKLAFEYSLVPPFLIPFVKTEIIDAGVKFRPSMKAGLVGKYVKGLGCESNKVLKNEKSVATFLSGCVGLALEFKVLKWKDKLKIDLELAGEACVTGKLGYDFANSKLIGKVILEPIVAKFKGEISALPGSNFEYEILNVEIEVELLDEIQLLPEKN